MERSACVILHLNNDLFPCEKSFNALIHLLSRNVQTVAFFSHSNINAITSHRETFDTFAAQLFMCEQKWIDLWVARSRASERKTANRQQTTSTKNAAQQKRAYQTNELMHFILNVMTWIDVFIIITYYVELYECVCVRTIDDKSTRSPRRKNSGKNVDVVETARRNVSVILSDAASAPKAPSTINNMLRKTWSSTNSIKQMMRSSCRLSHRFRMHIRERHHLRRVRAHVWSDT